jgi:hypothetical protein
VAGFCEHNDKLSGSTKDRDFLVSRMSCYLHGAVKAYTLFSYRSQDIISVTLICVKVFGNWHRSSEENNRSIGIHYSSETPGLLA